MQEKGFIAKTKGSETVSVDNRIDDDFRAVLSKYQASINFPFGRGHVDRKTFDTLMAVEIEKTKWTSDSFLDGLSRQQTFSEWRVGENKDGCFASPIHAEFSDEISLDAPRFYVVYSKDKYKSKQARFQGNSFNYVRYAVDDIFDHREEGPLWITRSLVGLYGAPGKKLLPALKRGQQLSIEYDSVFGGQTETAKFSLSGFTKAHRYLQNCLRR